MPGPLPDPYAWPVFAGLFLLSWGALYAALPAHRAVMWRASALTASFGLTQPLFVPEYWNPPGLWGLAAQTGFDLESVVFAFSVGGVGAVLLAALADAPMGPRARRLSLTRPPGATLALPFVFWMALTPAPVHAIHACLGAMAAGLVLTLRRRPDLTARCAAAGLAFTVYYGLFLAALAVVAPGYFGRIWNPHGICGVRAWAAPPWRRPCSPACSGPTARRCTSRSAGCPGRAAVRPGRPSPKGGGRSPRACLRPSSWRPRSRRPPGPWCPCSSPRRWS